MKRLIAILAMAATPAASSAADLRAIPAEFHGHWSLTAEQCKAGPLDNANVRVGANFIQDFTMRMAVRYVSAEEDGSLIAGGHVKAGSDSYDNVKRLALLENGAALAVGEGEDHSIYVRCKP